MDVGILADSALAVDVPASEVALAGDAEITELREHKDRGEAVAAMSRGAPVVVARLFAEGKLDGIIALGGSGGTSVACAAMRSLPLGVPKVMVSTTAGKDVSAYVGVKDIVMIPSIVDVAGINKISREAFARAAGAVCGMVGTIVPEGQDRPLIAASMFGNTTACVYQARKILEKAGYDVLVFHCTGTGGKAMESLIESGCISGVLDVTTTEWADQIVGGVFAAGESRLEAAARIGTPAIVAPGCIDMVNFWAPDTIPSKFDGRTFYQHNPNVTLMRTSVVECQKIGEAMAERINLSTGPVTVLIPKKGVSMIDLEGQSFYLPEANQAAFDALKSNLRKDISVLEVDCEINAPEFSETCARTLLEQIHYYN